jgi:tetratricopeptide (TPR) repeat protein
MPKEKPLGIYSTEKSSYVGMGATRRRVINKRLWMVWEYDDSALMTQALNQNLIPYGQRRVISVREFDQGYTRERDYYIDKSTMRPIWRPAGKSEEEALAEEVSDQPAAAPEDAPAYDEDSAAKAIEHSTRAAFGMGLTHLKTGNVARAREIFEELAVKPGNFKRRHKHMFNDFGIGLRKSKLLDVALKHYHRALGLSPDDENLYHNLARVYYEQGDMEKALENLDKSLELNPDLKESKLFRRFISKKKSRVWNLKFDL